MNPTLFSDLDYIVEQTEALWEHVRHQRIFITGGTGFFGCWLLESFVWANTKLNLQAKAVVLTRNPAEFAKKCPHLAQQACLEFYAGDVKDFIFPEGQFSHIIHAATDASAQLNAENPLLMLDTVIEGTRHTLEFAVACGAQQFLLTSSGAVYGRQSPELSHLDEEYSGKPDIHHAQAAYAVGKMTAEHLCCLFTKMYGLNIKIARCFAFVGPYLPLDIHFAIGNFIRDGLNGAPIQVNGDGSPYRSYLYAADLAIWLWTILFRGQNMRPYNVGSDEAISIKELAHYVGASFEPMRTVSISQTPIAHKLPERYVPSIQRARNELALVPKVKLSEALARTIAWHLTAIKSSNPISSYIQT